VTPVQQNKQEALPRQEAFGQIHALGSPTMNIVINKKHQKQAANKQTQPP
jgi:hypothetical protein